MSETMEPKRFVFNPALYIQRYQYVMEQLQSYFSEPMQKLADVGCAEGRFLSRLIRSKVKVKHIIGVDNYEPVVDEAYSNVQPIGADFIFKRPDPLTVDLFNGDCSKPDQRLLNLDALTCIELIEHLEADCLTRFPSTVFGVLQPKLVVISTPNKEFNPILGMQDHEIRHSDHKFEWTRKQFVDWCNKIVEDFENYTVSFGGVGECRDHPEVGYCSQFGVFKLVQNNSCLPTAQNMENHLKLVKTVVYPYKEVQNGFVQNGFYDQNVGTVENGAAGCNADMSDEGENYDIDWFRVRAVP